MKWNATIWMLMAGGLMAVTTAMSADEAATFRIVARPIPERGQVQAVEFSLGDKKASIILPNRWRVGGRADGLVLQSEDYGATVAVNSLEVKENSAPRIRAQASRVEVTSEYEWITRNGKATVVDALVAGDDDLRLQSRTYTVTLKDRTLVISVTAEPKAFNAVQSALANLVASLRIE